ncbi:MAG: 2-oxoglutarate dehydrogenase E1 component, partial [Gemmatimonadetes bacterium]|nr:2-oxoglutarate dehydrogenase E1 component [Gemmatimonadota bacterium]
MADLRQFHGPNAGYVLDAFERFTHDPESVDETWRAYFADFTPTEPAAPVAGGATVEQALAARSLAEAIRTRGHTAARVNPLRPPPNPDPMLRPESHGTGESEETRRLREVYCGTAGYEFEHIFSAEERAWLRDAVESRRFAPPLSAEGKRALLARLSEVEGFEKFLHKAFFGQKRFSIEGTDMLVPMLDEAIQVGGAAEVVIGMAHRGRLNVLTHVLGKPYSTMIGGFQGTAKPDPVPADPEALGPSGDVKYHMGWRRKEESVSVTLAPNPSHLEFVNPVVIGMARAAQDDTGHAGAPTLDPARALPVLVHGDTAFPGQGVVAETFNLSRVPGYQVGGTLHIIANNQIGFTTDPEESRSTRYSSDLAKGFEVPVVHVNADDPEACLAAVRLACAYRSEFGKDFLIDLIGYRRWGHNEGDVPGFTQPRLYEIITSHPTAREQWARTLADQGVVEPAKAEAMLKAVYDRMSEAQAGLAAGVATHPPSANGARPDAPPETGVDADALTQINEALLGRPEGWTPNAQLEKLLQRRREALQEGKIDWGHAETLAFASLLYDGIPVRLTGQDAERGTFSHRHLVLHDPTTGAKLNPLQALTDTRATFEVHNSTLSEMAVVGFEYGYSVADPDVLVLWEAQFGDFVNGAQVIIDQFLSAGEQKWGQRAGLVMLLPHGFEGQGPEHSSARLERFLQLAAEDNWRVANCTTSAQYFHLLRRQAALLQTDPRPLIVMSPKSLLRHPMAASGLEQLAHGRFQPVLGDESASERAGAITRLLLCSGKVYVDLAVADARAEAANVALVRVEELYPFPADALSEMIASFPALQEILWVQEEPRNMGAWSFVDPHLRTLAGDRLQIGYAGRPERASPAVGSSERHKLEQERIVAQAWGSAPQPPEAGGG